MLLFSLHGDNNSDDIGLDGLAREMSPGFWVFSTFASQFALTFWGKTGRGIIITWQRCEIEKKKGWTYLGLYILIALRLTVAIHPRA